MPVSIGGTTKPENISWFTLTPIGLEQIEIILSHVTQGFPRLKNSVTKSILVPPLYTETQILVTYVTLCL